MNMEIQMLIGTFLFILMLLGYRAFLKMHKSKLDDQSPYSASRTHTIVKYSYYLLLIVFIPYITISTVLVLFFLVVAS